MNILREQIKEALRHLPGEEAQMAMAPLKRRERSIAMQNSKDYRESAVAIILYQKSNQVYFTLIQRPNYDGAHGGQVALPGGKMDKIDKDLIETAKRESREEIGVKEFDLEILGELTPVFIPVSKFKVSPFIFWWKGNYEFVKDQREVDEILEIELSHLLDEERVKTDHFKVGGGVTLKDIPFFDLENRRVWGATAIILSEFKAVLNKFF